MHNIYFFFLLFASLNFSSIRAQEMNPEKLIELVTQVADTLQVNGNSIQFSYKQKPLICVYDENANRMRIISPIIETKNIEEEQLLNALVANFHSALDVKYALSDEIIWSVFMHPLKELYDYQVLDAIDQIYTSSDTFGNTYSSTALVFPGNIKKKDKPRAKKIIKIED